VASGADSDNRDGSRREADSVAAQLAREVAAAQASLLGRLRAEIGDGEAFASAAQRLAGDFGAVTASAVEAALGKGTAARPTPTGVDPPPGSEPPPPAGDDERHELPSLYRPGHMRRRLEQLVETNRRYGHPFGIAVFDASGPGVRRGDPGGGQQTILSVVGAALRDSIRIVDEAFRLEEDAICVLAPNLRTVEGVQMAERLLGQLEQLERVGGLRISVSAGVVSCPDHGADAEMLLQKADAAMWRARAVGQPVGVGALRAVAN
jgi:diguanylate cyclase (GGDEF)-like protein